MSAPQHDNRDQSRATLSKDCASQKPMYACARVMAVVDEHLTIHIEDAGDGWFVARIGEVPGAISQGRTPEEARVNVIAALHDLVDPRARPTDPRERLRTLAEDAARRLRSVVAR